MIKQRNGMNVDYTRDPREPANIPLAIKFKTRNHSVREVRQWDKLDHTSSQIRRGKLASRNHVIL